MNITISGLNLLKSFNRNVIFHPKIGCVSSVQASLVPLTLTTRHNLTSNISQPQKPPSAVSANLASATSSLLSTDEATLGRHLAQRLVQIGVSDVFSVPGDFNELNAGYAADGYARSRGVGACVVTFTVGGLSVLNAIAGAYSENLPVICIVGAPNSNDYGANIILHHTIGLQDFSQELH